VIAPSTAPRSHHSGRVFYVGAGLFVILLAIVGFGPSIIDPSRRNAALTPLVIAHGIVAGAWLILFVTQATLVLKRHVAIHRRLGLFGPVLAVVVMALGCMMLVEGGRRGYELSGDLGRAFNPPASPPLSASESAAGLLPPLTGFFSFGVLVAAGLWYRHRPDVHKRLMLLALVPLAGEPFVHLVGHLAGHWPVLQGSILFFVPVQLLLWFASAIHDKVSTGRIHPVSLWVPIVGLVWSNALNALVLPSTAWREIAEWLVRGSV
jgi:hypothetical protein